LLTFQIVGNLVRHLLRLPADFFEKRHVGDILSRLGSVQPIQDAITRGVVAAVIDGLMAMLAAAILFFYSPMLGMVVLVAVALNVTLACATFPALRRRMEEEIIVRAKDDIATPNVGFMLRNQLGIDFSGTNTAREGCELPPMQAGDVYTVDFHVELPELYPASFSFSPAIADGGLDRYSMCDWIDNALALQMSRSAGEIYGYMRLPCRVESIAKPAPDVAVPRRGQRPGGRRTGIGEAAWLSSRASG
jgi:hypothetical protein